MTEADIVKQLIAHDIDAYTIVPSTRPDCFASVERDGGSCDGYFDRASFTICAWGSSWPDAMTLANSVADALIAMPDEVTNVSTVDVASIYRLDDVSEQPCYAITVDTLSSR